jgi:uncharacterized integral membrane protein
MIRSQFKNENQKTNGYGESFVLLIGSFSHVPIILSHIVSFVNGAIIVLGMLAARCQDFIPTVLPLSYCTGTRAQLQ